MNQQLVSFGVELGCAGSCQRDFPWLHNIPTFDSLAKDGGLPGFQSNLQYFGRTDDNFSD